MTITREQYDIVDFLSDPTGTFASTPTEGNLLVVTALHRGASVTPSISGSGWTQRLHEEVLPANSTSRRTLTVYSKNAAASEPTAIQISYSSATNASLIIQEFSGVSDDDFAEIPVADNGDVGISSTVNSQVSGTTSALSPQNYFLLSLMGTKDDGGSAVNGYTMTNDLAAGIYNGDVAAFLCTGWGEKTVSGTQSTTGTFTASTVLNRGHVHALGVWAAASMTITDVDTDFTWDDGDQNLVIAGTGFV